MTSTTFSNKGFFPLFKWALRQNRGLLIVYSIILLISGPILDGFIKLRISAENLDYVNMIDVELVSSLIYAFTAAIIVLISAVRTFSFLHNKRSVDMYGAFPVIRKTVFLSHILAGLLTTAVPYIIGMAAVMGITYFDGESLRLGAVMMLFTLLMIVASYLFTVLMAYCCGTSLDTVCVTIAVNGIWVGVFSLFKMIMSMMIPGCSVESILSSFADVAFAPLGFMVLGAKSYFTGGFTPVLTAGIVWSVLYIALVFVGCLFAANKRKAHTAQDGFSVKWLPVVTESGIALIIGMAIGFVFALAQGSDKASMFTFSFWFIIGAAAAFAVVHIYFNKGVKCHWGKSIAVCSSVSAVCIAAVISLCGGWGIDTYIPSAGGVSSAEISVNGVGYSFGDAENVERVLGIHKLFVDGTTTDRPYSLSTSSIDNVEYLDIASESADDLEKVNDYDYDNTYPVSYKFKYKTKLGAEIVREYHMTSYKLVNTVDTEKMMGVIEELISSAEVKKQSALAAFDDEQRNRIQTASLNMVKFEKQYDKVRQTETYQCISHVDSVDLDKEQINELYAALKMDIEADDSFVPADWQWSGYTDESQLGDVYTVLTLWSKDISGLYAELNNGQYASSVNTQVIVKENYKNTLAFLEKYNIKAIRYYTHSSTYADTEGGYEAMEKYMDSLSVNDLKALVDLYATGWLADCYDDFGIKLNDKQFDDYTAQLEQKIQEQQEWLLEDYTAYLADGGTAVQIDDWTLCIVLDSLAEFTQQYFIHLEK